MVLHFLAIADPEALLSLSQKALVDTWCLYLQELISDYKVQSWLGAKPHRYAKCLQRHSCKQSSSVGTAHFHYSLLWWFWCRFCPGLEDHSEGKSILSNSETGICDGRFDGLPGVNELWDTHHPTLATEQMVQIALAQVGAIDVSPSGAVKALRNTETCYRYWVHVTAVIAVTCFVSLYSVFSFHWKAQWTCGCGTRKTNSDESNGLWVQPNEWNTASCKNHMLELF